jgi:AcrR family transcriptional regulator
MGCSIPLVDWYINSVDVVFNKDRISSRGRTELTVETRDAKRKLPAERRGELLTKAVEIAAAEGLSAVTLRRVAADLGVTPGLVSHYFSSAEQLIIAAFRAAAVADLAAARSCVDAADGPVDKMAALMDYVLDDTSDDASALWLEAWSLGRRNAPLAAEAKELTDEWLVCIADIVRAGVADEVFHVADVDVAARRLLTMIDGLGAQKVVRAVPVGEAKHIARAYFASELGVTG